MSKPKLDVEPSSPNSEHANRVKPLTNEEEAKPVVSGVKPYDPFDPDNMRVSQAALKSSAKKLITSYTIRKPRKNAYFRVHPDEAYQYITYTYVEKDEAEMEKETYMVTHRFSDELDDEFKCVMQGSILYLAKERHAEKAFVWKMGFPLDGAKDCKYWESGREIAELAKTQWVRLATGVGCYDYYEPTIKSGRIPDPEWPETPFGEILRMAFKNRVIDSMDHPVMQALAHME